MSRYGVPAAMLVAAFAVPAGAAETPSPAPEDRSTTVSVSPASGPDRSTLVLRGFSDCAVIDGHLLFTRYDGRPDNVVARTTTKTYDYAREKYPYIVRLTVPATARPGPAEVYAEPFCGPPEEYPPSARRAFRVASGVLALRVSPTRLEPGELLRVGASTCDGAHGPVTVRVRQGGDVREVAAPVDAAGRLAATVRVGGGDGEVSLPRAAEQCPGSTRPAVVAFSVRAPVVVTSAATRPASATPSAPPTTSASSLAASPTASPTAATTAPVSGRGSGRSPLLPLALLGLGLAAGAAVLLRRRRAA